MTRRIAYTILSIIISLHFPLSAAVYGQSIEEATHQATPAPIVSQINEAPSPVPEQIQEIIEATPTPTPQQQSNDITPTPLPDIAALEPVAEPNMNEAMATPSAQTNEQSVITPEPSPTNAVSLPPQSPEPSVETAPSLSVVSIANTLNTNAIGGNPVIQNEQGGQSDIDLTDKTTCINADQDMGNIFINNNANLETSIDIESITGGNILESGQLETGGALAKTNISNLINTNLIGSCWNFMHINVFDRQDGDILLPYELDYLMSGIADMKPAAPLIDYQVKVNNTATIEANLVSMADTGNNLAATVESGQSNNDIRIMDTANTNIYGSNWLMLQVNAFEGWSGNLKNWWGDQVSIGNRLFAWLKVPNSDKIDKPESTVQIENNADVDNTVTSYASTGGNSVSSGSIKTGNAASLITLINRINTNIIGNNWYYAVLNLFDEFTGDVVFARPDIVVSGRGPDSASPGDLISQSFRIANTGSHLAENTQMKAILPDNAECVSAEGGVCVSGKAVWDPVDLNKEETKTVSVVFKLNPVPTEKQIITVFTASTTTDEPVQSNNSVTLSVATKYASGHQSEVAYSQNTNSTSVSPVETSALIQTISDEIPLTPRIIFADYRQVLEDNDSQIKGVQISIADPKTTARINLLKIMLWFALAGVMQNTKRKLSLLQIKRKLMHGAGGGR